MSPAHAPRQPVLAWIGWLLIMLAGVLVAGSSLLVVARWWGVTLTP